MRLTYVLPPPDSNTGSKKEEKKKRRLGIVQYYDMLEGAIAKAKHEEPTIQCKKGCNACCKQPISVTYAEAEYIVDKYPKEVESALKRIKHYDHVSKQIETEKPNDDKCFADAWWPRQLPCPLLKNNLCSVYEARPAPCRNYFVKSDPALCAKPEKTRVLMVLPVHPKKQMQVMRSLQPRSGYVSGWFWEMLLKAWEERK